MTRTLALVSAAALSATIAGAALAQTATSTAPQTAAAGDAQMRARGETYRRSPDSKQNPAEVEATRRLNSEIAARNAAADRQDAANQARSAEQEAAYQADRAQYQEERALSEAERAAEARAVAAFNADQRARYEKAMADWRATTRACQTGDAARCRAGQQRPIVTDF